MLKNINITFIGGGHIAEIIIQNLVQKGGTPPENISVSDPDRKRCQYLANEFGISMEANNVTAAQSGDLILICVHPPVVRDVLPDLVEAELRPNQVVISVAAGIPLSAYRSLGDQQPMVRALPNPPSKIGQGIAPLIFTPTVSAEQRKHVLALFSSLGEWVEVDESQINAITSLSSPVTTYLFFQSLVEAGIGCGLSHSIAEKVAAQTIIGSMAVWEKLEVSPIDLIEEASTPGGVSVESIRVLEQHGFKSAILDAIHKGASRAEELGGNSIEGS